MLSDSAISYAGVAPLMRANPIPLQNLSALCTILITAVQRVNHWLCHSFICFLQLQGAFCCLVLACGWIWAGCMRLKEVRRLQAQKLQSMSDKLAARHGASASIAIATGAPKQASQAHDSKACLPGLTVVLPIQGLKAHSLLNWQSQLGMHYAGPLEYLFVTQSASDPALPVLSELISCDYEAARTQIIISGPSSSCSQKIHNLQRGILKASKASKYVLCLDDDVQLHPGFLEMAVGHMEADSAAFMLTGYPFDIADPGAGVLTYAALAYHLPLLIAFSVSQSTSFVWGGCMLFPLESMVHHTFGIMQAWQEGGYSDDLIVAAKCAQHKLKILCPSGAIFPQRLEARYSWKQYWNYLRRQLYVMDTYASCSNKRINHALMLIHCYLSWAVVFPITSVVLRLSLWVAELLLLPSQEIWDGPGTSWDWLRIFGAQGCYVGMLSSILFWIAITSAVLALYWMTGVVLSLFGEMFPSGETISGGDSFNWVKLWLGFYLGNAVLPCCMLYTYLSPWVEWGGIWYYKRKGRVQRLLPHNL